MRWSEVAAAAERGYRNRRPKWTAVREFSRDGNINSCRSGNHRVWEVIAVMSVHKGQCHRVRWEIE
jgi:hypothetical protein